LLAHAPAVFEFRDRRDIYFPFLGTSGDVPITPLYEYFPLGFKTLQRYLSERGHEVALVNLSTLFLRYPKLTFEAVAEALDVRLFGIDLHWMVHVQGSLEIAQRLKALRPDIQIIFGGISSTYYAEELVRLPYVDMVMRGYDTHAPMAMLLDALRNGGDLHAVPNLLWTTRDAHVQDNGFSYLPDSFSCGIDWSRLPAGPSEPATFPIREFLSTQNAGCSYNCPWCGGSREAFRRIFPRKRAMARKPLPEIAYEFESMSRVTDVDTYHFYSVGSYNESPSGLEHFLARVAEASFKSISFEQFHLPAEDVLRRMVAANSRTIITLSPESHDIEISRQAGRGVYTNDELEAWIARALEIGIHEIDIWYFVGMKGQDERSVMETVDYCERLLTLFAGANVNPMICPMIPFLDPASTFFEQPNQHGYRVFFRTAEDHRRGMERASIINRINYETEWLSRADLVRVGFTAVRRLMEAKAETGFLPASSVARYNAKIDDALEFIPAVHEADCIASPVERAAELELLGDDILRRNHEVLFAGVRNQAFPINREIGGRWFDELGWRAEDLDAVAPRDPTPVNGRVAPAAPSGPAATTRGTLPSV
jgi:clorobiocin biosynthesis protein CloN6